MHRSLGMAILASGILATSLPAQVAPPLAPPGGGMMRADANKDGVVSRAEMLADAADRAGARFNRLDTNGDGKLDAAEMATARPIRGPRGGGDVPPALPPR